VDPIVAYREDHPARIPFYEAASWGPAQADHLLARDDRSWHNPG
jgi:glucose-6-phosphate 1-dehydrogenase